MANLNVAVIVRYVDRMTAGARRSVQALAGLSKGQKGVATASIGASTAVNLAAKSHAGLGRAAQLAAAGNVTVGRTAVMAAASSGTFSKAADVLTNSTLTLTGGTIAAGRAALEAGRQQTEAGRATEGAGRQAEVGARRFSLLERSQMRAAAASRVLKGRAEALERQLTTLAKVSLVTEGMDRAGHFLGHPIAHAVGDAANFAGGMTGFGITAEMTDAQMAPIRKAILAASRQYALSPEDALETFAYTRRSGVFRKPQEIISAGRESVRFQKLAERMGSPVTGEDAAGGASSAVREYGFAPTAAGLRHYYAMIDAAEKTGGGAKIGDLLQYSRSSGGLMKSFGSGNQGGLADVLAAHQVSMFLSHSGGQAGINVQDLLMNISHKMTVRRFKKMGVDLPAVMQRAWEKGQSPLEAFTRLVWNMTEKDKGPRRQFAMGHLMANQQAGQSLFALSQNLDKFDAYRHQIVSGGAVKQYDGDVKRVLNDPKTIFERWGAAKSNLAISAGVLLLPTATKLATALTKLVDLMTRFADKGGVLGKMAMFAATGFAGLAIGAGALGHVIVGVLGPLYIMRGLFKDILPLSAELAKAKTVGFAARAAGAAKGIVRAPARAMGAVWRMAGVGADAASGGLKATWRGIRRAPGAVRTGAGVLARGLANAPGAAFRGVISGASAAARMVRGLGTGGAGAISRIATAVRSFSFGSMITGLRAMGVAMIGFARSGRMGALAMNIFKFSVRGVLAASGVGLLILAAGFLIEHWRGVVTFFKGFGSGFMKAIAPIRPALQPLINVVKMAATWVGKLFGGGGKGGAEDWSKWGEIAGAAVGKVVLGLAKLIGWLGTAIAKGVEFWNRITGHAAAAAGAAAVVMPAAAAAGAPPPPPHAVTRPAGPVAPSPNQAAKSGPGAKAPVHVAKVEQHFHVTQPQQDPKKLAAEMQRQGDAALRRGAFDDND